MHDARFLDAVRTDLAAAGLRASIVVRDLGTGRELDLDGDVVTPAASLAKVPIALSVLTRVADGRLDGSAPVAVPAGDPTGALPGTTRFRHPSVIAVDDLVGLALTISDNGAADALLGLVPPAEVMADLEAIGVRGIAVRHPFADLSDTPLERFAPDEAHLAHTLAIRGSTPAHGHPIRQLDVARTNTGRLAPSPTCSRRSGAIGACTPTPPPRSASTSAPTSSVTGSPLTSWRRHGVGVEDGDAAQPPARGRRRRACGRIALRYRRPEHVERARLRPARSRGGARIRRAPDARESAQRRGVIL